MVIWITGLSGSGKTTLSKLLYDRLKPAMPNLIRLDGDAIRALFGNDVDHSVEGRHRNAERLSYLSKYIADQGVNVIAAVLSIFPDMRKWNRANIPGYVEVYLKTSMEILVKRDKKNLYAPGLEGKLKNVVGVDILFPEPENTDLVIDNNEERDDLKEYARQIISLPVVKKIIKAGK